MAVAAVLIYAAVQKIWMPLEFARLIKEYHLLPNQILNLVAIVLPWVEMVCGICFFSGLWLLGASVLLSGMNTIFVFAITYRACLIMSETGGALPTTAMYLRADIAEAPRVLTKRQSHERHASEWASGIVNSLGHERRNGEQGCLRGDQESSSC